MTGPTPTDLAAALRSPAAVFADPALRAADPVLGADGLPLAYPGDRAVVFQLCPPGGGHGWAVKCYPAADPALADRYARVAELVGRGQLPFAVPCRFLGQGLQAGGSAVPAAVLDWVEGVPLDRAVRDRVDDPAAAVHRLFRGWVQVAAGLRAAGASHGELGPANVLVAPGADSIRLVDYDSFHLPGLPPAADAGHTGFRHPFGADPADRDRFPLLVIGTALRAVAVLGRGVCDRYPAAGGLLFTAADFRDPAASPLLRELTSSSDPQLRTLAGAVARACGRPAEETPWLVDLCPDLDEEDHPVGLAAPEVRSAPSPGKPKPRLGYKTIAALAAVLLIGVAAVGIGTDLFAWPEGPTDAGTHPPKAPELSAGPQPATRPAAEAPAPRRPAPAVAQLAPAGVGFQKMWTVNLADDRPVLSVHLTADGRTVLVQRPDRIETFDARAGEALATLRGPGLPTEAARIWSLATAEAGGMGPGFPDEDDRGRSFAPDDVWVYGHPLPAPTAWQARTGVRLDDPIKGVLAPAGPRGGGPDWCEVSPGGRYVFAANYGKVEQVSFDGGKTKRAVHHPAPYELTDVENKRRIESSAFFGGPGRARFSADRVLVAGASGDLKWVRAWDGQAEIGWRFPPAGADVPDRLPGLSADGALAVLWLTLPGKMPGYYLIDARTGRSLRELGPTFTPGRTVLTADGRWVAGLVSGPPDPPEVAAQIADARTGAVLVHTRLASGSGDIGPAAVSDDGRVLVVHIPGRKELTYFAIKGDVPPVPVGTPIPPPAAPPPETSHPWLNPGKPALRPGARSALPDVPVIPPRWMVKTSAALQALAGPQAPLYTPDGKTLVLSGGAAGTVLTYDAATGKAGPVFEGHKGLGGVDWVGVYADRVVSAGFDGPPVTWSARTGKRVDDGQFPALPPLPVGARGHAGFTWAVSPNGRYFAAARRELGPVPGPLRLQEWGGANRKAAEWRGSPGNVAFTRDGERMFVLDGLGKGTWYSFPSFGVQQSWDLGDSWGGARSRVLGMWPDGKRVVVQGFDGIPNAVVVLDGQTGRFLTQLRFPYWDPTAGFALSPDGRLAAVAVYDGGIVRRRTDVVATDRWRSIAQITHPPESTQDHAQVRFSPNGKEFAVFFRGGKELAVYPAPDPDPPVPALPERWATAVGVKPFTTIVYDPATRRLALPRPDGDTVTILDADTGAGVAAGPSGWKWGRGCTPHVLTSGRLGYHDGQARAVEIWDLKAGKPADPLPLAGLKEDGPGPQKVWLSPDGRYAATYGAGTKVVERATGKLVVSVGWPAYSVAFTADGGRVLLAAADGKHRWFDLPSGDPGPSLVLGPPPPALKIRGPDISADGTRIGSVLRAGLPPVVYDWKAGRVVREFGREYARDVPAAVSADGRLCAAMRAPRAGGVVWLDVLETASGRLVGRATFPGRNIVPGFFFTADGRGLVVHEADEMKVRWFYLSPRQAPVPPPAKAPAPPTR